MQQRTDIPALREALAKADKHDTQGEWIQRDATQVRLCQQLPALLDELEELRRFTTPEVIGEKHRDGNWWMVWEPGYEQWVKCRFVEFSWRVSGNTHPLWDAPTHALPMPGEVRP